jgi:hypothetical protein
MTAWLRARWLPVLAFGGLLVSFAVLGLRQLPCSGGSWKGETCYSDITALYWNRGLLDGQVPYLDADFEYPVLTGYFVELARRIAVLLGARSEPGLSGDAVQQAAGYFFVVNAALLALCFLVLIWAHLRLAPPVGAVMVAVSPAVWMAGLVNWDALVVMLTSSALLAWSRRRPMLCGALIGLGVAAKLYPLLLLIPLAVLCLRGGKWLEYFKTVYMAAVAWFLANLPILLLAPERWLRFWTFNVERDADLGSIWYVLGRAGVHIPHLSLVEAVLLVAGTAAICLLLLFARQRPRLAQAVFLLVAWFLVVNKVYSPQYMLWLLPLLVLARPRWLDWTLFSVAETCYFVEIWRHLDAVSDYLGWEGTDPVYAFAVILRIAVQLFLCGRVVADILHPERDPVRLRLAPDGSPATLPSPSDTFEDPDSGPLYGAPDAPWLKTLRAKITCWRAEVPSGYRR